MKNKLLSQYLTIVFVIATFMGSLHHHNDFKIHTDCQVCTLQHNVTDIDTPSDVNYVALFSIKSESTLLPLTDLQTQQTCTTFSARAPPIYT